MMLPCLALHEQRDTRKDQTDGNVTTQYRKSRGRIHI